MQAETTVAIADDHALIRGGLRTLLESEPGLRVAGEASDVASTLALVRAEQPDVLVLDVSMGESSVPAIPRLLDASPRTAVVMLTMHDEPAVVREALHAGARGYVLKDAADSELVEAVRSAAEGRTYLEPGIGARLGMAAPAGTAPQTDLSGREVEVLRLIALGHTNAEIADQLYLSVRTVESHRAHIQRKLRLSTRAQLVRYALEHRMLRA